MARTRTRRADPPLLVVEISLGASERDHDVTVEFLGRPVRLLRIGTDGDLRTAETLVRRWVPLADAIAVNGAAEALATGALDTDPAEAIARLKAPPPTAPLTDGRRLHEVLQEWSVRWVQNEMPGYFSNARTIVLGADHARTVRVLREFTDNIHVQRPPTPDGWAGRLSPRPRARRHRQRRRLAAAPGQRRRARGHPSCPPSSPTAPGWRTARRTATSSSRPTTSSSPPASSDLHGKAVITSAVTDDQLADLAARDVDLVVDTTPQPYDVTIDVATLEAMMRATVRAPGGAPERLATTTCSRSSSPRVWSPGCSSRTGHAARAGSRSSSTRCRSSSSPRSSRSARSCGSRPSPSCNAIEKAMAYAPPMVYSHVTGITSPTGAEAEGWLITVGGTPKEILAHDPEFTYEKLLAAAEVARGLGAQIMGLGAFTKVVGDAGVTVARKSSLPITTGNSYSASGALWAAHEAVDRLGLLERGDDGIIHGRTMVVGATGAIGSVCARLLALASDELWLVSPETAKLLALKQDIEREHPRAVVHAAATPGEHLADMDVIVTATSGAGKRVLDIMDVKPGCVITDVARPLDLSAEDVAKRPDVLVVESGEIELPGDDVQMRDIGLPTASPTPAWRRRSPWPSRDATRRSRSAGPSSGRRSRRSTSWGFGTACGWPRSPASTASTPTRTSPECGSSPWRHGPGSATRQGSPRPRPRHHDTPPGPGVWCPPGGRRHDTGAPPTSWSVVPRWWFPDGCGQSTSCPGCASVGMVPSRPAWKSSNAWTSSSRVFITNGP